MIDSTRRSLMFHGCLLFFLGLTLVGLGAAFGLYASYRPAVAGHVEAVLNGMWMCVVALILPSTDLGRRGTRAVYWLLLAGTYPHVLGYLLAAVWGVRIALLPQGTSGGVPATPFQDQVLAVILLGPVTIGMIGHLLILLYGLRRFVLPWGDGNTGTETRSS